MTVKTKLGAKSFTAETIFIKPLSAVVGNREKLSSISISFYWKKENENICFIFYHNLYTVDFKK